MDTKTFADRSSLLLPTRSRISETLHDKRFVSQARDENDGGHHVIAVTPAGQSITDERAAQAAEIVTGFKAKLGDENDETRLDLLDRCDLAANTWRTGFTPLGPVFIPRTTCFDHFCHKGHVADDAGVSPKSGLVTAACTDQKRN